MPYRVSEAIVEKRKYELDIIVGAPNNVAAFKVNDPERLSYLIREALHASRTLEIEPYASLNIRLSVNPPHLFVTAKTQLESIAVPVDMHDMATEVGVVIVIDITSPFGVISAAMINSLAPEIHFPGYEGDLTSVEVWAGKKGYEVEQQEGVLILRRQQDV
jgi:hypothetical protein